MARMLGKGRKAVPARDPGERVTRGCAAWKLRASTALRAWRGACELVRPQTPGHPSQPALAESKAATRPRTEKRPVPASSSPQHPALGLGAMPSHLPADRRSPQTSECGASPTSDRSGAQPPLPDHAPHLAPPRATPLPVAATLRASRLLSLAVQRPLIPPTTTCKPIRRLLPALAAIG